jgi:hypothetical protein
VLVIFVLVIFMVFPCSRLVFFVLVIIVQVNFVLVILVLVIFVLLIFVEIPYSRLVLLVLVYVLVIFLLTNKSLQHFISSCHKVASVPRLWGSNAWT